MRKTLLIIFLVLLSCLPMYAQNSLADDGSIYSQYGVGVPVQVGSSNAVGAGVWGVSDIEPMVANVSNPAIWGFTTFGLASGGAEIKSIHSIDNFGSAQHTSIIVDHFQLQVPIKKNKLGLSVSFTPYTRVAYTSVQTGNKLKYRSVTYKTKNNASGGVNRYEVGVGWRINKYLAVGYGASFYHLSITNNITTTFSSRFFTPVHNKIVASGTGFGSRLGILLRFPSVGRDKGALNIGLTASLPVTIKGQRTEESIFVSGSKRSRQTGSGDQTLATGTVRLPLGLTAGITYQPSSLMAFSVEGRFQRWSHYKNELKHTLNGVSFKNRLKVGVGFQYFPVYSGSNKFLSNFKYRIGANYDTGYLRIHGEAITALKFTAGIGILTPTKVQGFNSSIDINFYYGIIGTKDHNLVKEHIFGVKLTLNLAELFFFRPKLK